MKTKSGKTDTSPRFGWTSSLDNLPQIVWEKRLKIHPSIPVAVIPLPYVSAKIRRRVREFVNGQPWPKE